MGQASLMFGAFLGVFGGATCVAEEVSGSKGAVNVFAGGTAAGAVLAARTGSPRAMLLTAVATGSLTALLHVVAQV